MKEEFLHYVWKNGLYQTHKLKDNEGNSIEVISPGQYNRDSGPDFFNARIRTGTTEWAGNIEIHLRSSDFYSHGHQSDHAFDNLILHVVHHNDGPVYDSRGRKVTTVELQFDASIYERYTSMINNPLVIACQDDLQSIERFYLRHWLNAILVERLKEKADVISGILNDTGNDWEEVFYRVISRYFGFRVNTGPFEMLASALPFRIIKKHIDNRFQVEALLFGAAGMLDEELFREAINDRYYTDLIREFRILSAKYSIQPIHGWVWKFSRLRPVNFPTLRISQLAGMLSVAGGLFSRILETTAIDDLKSYFEADASDYWDEHYVFGKLSRIQKKRTGGSATDILLINSVVPIIFVYGLLRNSTEMKERALSFLDQIKAEENVIIREWGEAGVRPSSAFESQALIHLRENYCRRRKCLECRIGTKLIASGHTLKSSEELILEP